eukprot:TRINITY_DN4494_c0_g1_i2.p1 TRINITY_DN4494_c0_g1~~TRINITY_DN4494_c0_g1_i2.p1  ORF type:complete len:161 (+),score=35.03 TRINITY_DN4494_c0_g1_i2:237-719(+)
MDFHQFSAVSLPLVFTLVLFLPLEVLLLAANYSRESWCHWFKPAACVCTVLSLPIYLYSNELDDWVRLFSRPFCIESRDKQREEAANNFCGFISLTGCTCVVVGVFNHLVVLTGLAVTLFLVGKVFKPVSYTHLRAHETVLDLVCRLLLEKKKNQQRCHI